MKKIKKSIIIVLILLFIAPIFSSEDLEKVVNSNLSQFNKILTSKASINEKKVKFAKIYNHRFAHYKMARNILKSEWKKLSRKQRKLFANKISKFIFLFYFNKLKIYGKADIKILKIKYNSNKTRAKVYTRFTVKNTKFKSNYKMILKKGIWKFYDVEIEGIRVSSTYRPQFQKVLRKHSFKELIRRLDKLINKYNK